MDGDGAAAVVDAAAAAAAAAVVVDAAAAFVAVVVATETAVEDVDAVAMADFYASSDDVAADTATAATAVAAATGTAALNINSLIPAHIDEVVFLTNETSLDLTFVQSVPPGYAVIVNKEVGPDPHNDWLHRHRESVSGGALAAAVASSWRHLVTCRFVARQWRYHRAQTTVAAPRCHFHDRWRSDSP